MRRYEKEPVLGAFSFLVSILYFLIWKPIVLIFSFFNKLAGDVFTDVYGRLVKYLGWLIFLILIAGIISIFPS